MIPCNPPSFAYVKTLLQQFSLYHLPSPLYPFCSGWLLLESHLQYATLWKGKTVLWGSKSICEKLSCAWVVIPEPYSSSRYQAFVYFPVCQIHRINAKNKMWIFGTRVFFILTCRKGIQLDEVSFLAVNMLGILSINLFGNCKHNIIGCWKWDVPYLTIALGSMDILDIIIMYTPVILNLQSGTHICRTFTIVSSASARVQSLAVGQCIRWVSLCWDGLLFIHLILKGHKSLCQIYFYVQM